MRNSFLTLFQSITGIQYTNSIIILTTKQYNNLPIIIYHIEDTNGQILTIECEPTSYVERMLNNKYAFRIYLTESIGSVLGANFMLNHNIIFDIDNKRMSINKSNCTN